MLEGTDPDIASLIQATLAALAFKNDCSVPKLNVLKRVEHYASARPKDSTPHDTAWGPLHCGISVPSTPLAIVGNKAATWMTSEHEREDWCAAAELRRRLVEAAKAQECA